MGKKKLKSKAKQNIIKFNVSDYPFDSSFFFDVSKIYSLINNLKNIQDLKITENEATELSSIITKMIDKIKVKKGKSKVIEILPLFK